MPPRPSSETTRYGPIAREGRSSAVRFDGSLVRPRGRRRAASRPGRRGEQLAQPRRRARVGLRAPGSPESSPARPPRDRGRARRRSWSGALTSRSPSSTASQARANSQSRLTVRGRDLEALGDLVDLEAGEVAHLDDPRGARRFAGEPLERAIEVEKIDRGRGRTRDGDPGRGRFVARWRFLRARRARVVDEHAAHRRRGEAEEVGPVAPVDARLVDQPQVGLVDERRSAAASGRRARPGAARRRGASGARRPARAARRGRQVPPPPRPK